MENHEYFEYKEKGKSFFFQRTKEGGFICWKCGGTYKRIVKHLQYKKTCRENIDMDQFIIKLREYRLDEIRKDQNSRKRKSIDKKRVQLGDALVKIEHNSREKKSIDKKRDQLGDALVKIEQNSRQKRFIDKRRVEIGPLKLKEDIKERQSKWRKRKTEEEPENLRNTKKENIRLSRKRQKLENYEKVKRLRTNGKLKAD